MRLISWNVQGRLRSLPAQLAALAERQPDIVALQEVREATLAPLRDGLRAIGLPYGAESVTLALALGRRYGLLIASRWPAAPLAPFALPYPERVVSALIDRPCGPIELHNTHVPQGGRFGWIKIETCEGIYRQLARAASRPRVLCGDFNSPQAELPDGQLITFGQERQPDGSYDLWGTREDAAGRVGTGQRWDQGERSVLAGLAAFDLTDVFRRLHGPAAPGVSWRWRDGERTIGRRFDHIFASEALEARACDYLGVLLERDLSDHAPIEATFAPAPGEMRAQNAPELL